MGVFLKKVSKKAKPLKPESTKVSFAKDLKVIRSEENRVVKKFLAASPEFMQKHEADVSVAARLILSDLRKLKNGGVVEKEGFVIRAERTGIGHPGSNTELALSVSFKGKTFFVKIGGDTGGNAVLAYQRAKAFFAQINNRVLRYKVDLVPYHLLYLKSQTTNMESRGFLVSDFFPSSRVALVEDIAMIQGGNQFYASSLGKAVMSVRKELSKQGVGDAGNHNCFVDIANKTIYFFDLRAV